MNNIDQVTISKVNVSNNTSFSATLNVDKSVDPMIFLTNFCRWTETSDFAYHWFSDYVSCCNIQWCKTYDEFYHHFLGNWIMDDMPIGYDSKQAIIMFYSTMIAKAPLTVDISTEYVPVKGHIINGKLYINESYLTENNADYIHGAVYNHILSLYPDEDRMDVYNKTKDLQKSIYKVIAESADNVEVHIEEIDFIFTKNVDVDLKALKSYYECMYK